MHRFTMLGKDRDGEPHVAQNVTPDQAKKVGRALELTGFLLFPEGVSRGDSGPHQGFIHNPENPSGYDKKRVDDWVYGGNLLKPPKGWKRR
jgi:hypothetical protein